MSHQAMEWQDHVLAQLYAGAISIEEAEQLLLHGPHPGATAHTAQPSPRAADPAAQPLPTLTAADIAIIGIACRFAGANDWRTLWENLKNGVDSMGEVPANRWSETDWYHPEPGHPGKAYVRTGGFLDAIDHFDAPFFQISPPEATVMDPQQRIFLEEAYHAIEDAGYAPEGLKGKRCGVFVGAAQSGYAHLLAAADLHTSRLVMTGMDASVLAARIAYFLDLQGPAIAVDTACSSALTAIHLACESLRRGETELALAGGITIGATPLIYIQTSQFQMLAPDGRSKTFDAAANGFAPGEGCGVLLLKPAAQALADGDSIYAIIKGSAINQDGSTNGITAPSVRAQAQLERRLYAELAINPATIGYVEAHGTGTALGDPIEVEALTTAFAHFTDQKQFCAIGSIKTNIGHTGNAAGVAGVIKAVLSLKDGQLVPSLHFQQPNPHIDFANSPFFVSTRLQEWLPPADHPRRAAVSSFGISGTNVHLLLEAAPGGVAPARRPAVDQPYQLFTLATKAPELLPIYAQRYLDFLQRHPELALGDLCYTLHTGRSHFAHRLTLVAASISDLQQQLAAYVRQTDGAAASPVARPTAPRVGFLFTGQGAQYVGMGRALYATSPLFRGVIDECDGVLQAEFGYSLLPILYPAAAADGAATLLDETTYTQPALYALEVGVARLWQRWGIEPTLLLGHSVGEIAAACVAGVFSLADGLRLVAARGQLMGALPKVGTMVAVQAGEAQVAALVAPYAAELAIAAVNGPTQVVIAGRHAAVAAVVEQLTALGVKTRPLTVSHAFHSPLMEPMIAAFRQVAQGIRYQLPQLPLVSNVTGKLAGAEVATPAYWVTHVRAAVRFADGVATMQAHGVDAYLEIGPKPVLVGMVAQAAEESTPPLLASLREGQPEWQQLLTSLGTLYRHGCSIHWAAVDGGAARQKVILPTYPFQRQRYWVTPPAQTRAATLSPLIDQLLKAPALGAVVGETAVSVARLPWLADHRVYGEVMMPGAGHLSMVVSGAALAFAGAPIQLTDVIFPQALTLANGETRLLQLLMTTPASAGQAPAADFRLVSYAAAAPDAATPMATHATGRLGVSTATPASALSLRALQARCTEAILLDPTHDYDIVVQGQVTIQFGPAFRWLAAAWRTPAHPHAGADEVLVKLCRPPAVASLAGYHFHPGLLDGCFQATSLTRRQADAEAIYLPFALASLQLYAAVQGDHWWCHVQPIGAAKWHLRLFDQWGQLVAELHEFEMRAVTASQLHAPPLRTDWLYALEWRATPTTPQERLTECWLPAQWLIVGPESTTRAALVAALRADQQTVTTLATTVAAKDIAAVRHFIANLAHDHQTLGVIFLGELPTEEGGEPALAPAQAHTFSVGLLQLIQACLACTLDAHLWLVTWGSQAVRGVMTPLTAHGTAAAAAAALWGLGRTLSQEQPHLSPVCIDLDPHLGIEQQLDLLRQELMGGPLDTPPANQIAFRQGVRYVAHLTQWQAPAPLDPALPQRLQLRGYGSVDELHFAPLTRQPPARGEIEIEVKAAALNFRDLLNTLGMLQSYYATVLGISKAEAVGLGFECAGVVTAVGAGVTALGVGDRVMGLSASGGALGSYLTLPASQVMRIPDHIDDSEAATIPLAFLTAWYGLVELAKLQADEWVLIHAAAGGVGQAAVQIAQLCGAKVIATASPGKWECLHQQGVRHVFNSRTLAFREEILHLTAGKGVDVVLNSLNSDFIPYSFDTLRQAGRFVEIGKLGIWSNEQVAQVRPDVTYYPYDLGERFAQDPTLQSRIWQTLAEQLQAQTLRPLPKTSFPAHAVVAAFRTMQQATHIGKIVIDFTPKRPLLLQPEATYLITGGLGALGLQIAQQFVAEGAKHLVLTGRQGVTNPAQAAALATLRDAGAAVHIMPADIADAESVRTLLADCHAIAPLRGIVHAAGVLDDGVWQEQSPARFATALRPKVDGLWHLHTLTQAVALDFFACFSSAAALLGSPGQSNYAAANAFMDTFMQQRQQAGLCGVAIQWGAWAEGGMAAHPHVQRRLAAQGMRLIAPQEGRRLFSYLLQQPVAQIGVLPFNHEPLREKASAPPVSMRLVLADLPQQERQAQLTAHVQRELVAVLGLRPDHAIDARTRLFDFGLDSLMAVELKNRLQRALDCPLRSTVLFDYPTLELLIPHLLQALGQDEADAAAATHADLSAVERLQEVQQLLPADLLSLLNQELQDIR